MKFALDRIVGVKDAQRTMPTLLERVQDGEPVVLTRRGKPRGVLLSIERYEELLTGERVHLSQYPPIVGSTKMGAAP